jgi:hypothetical protein
VTNRTEGKATGYNMACKDTKLSHVTGTSACFLIENLSIIPLGIQMADIKLRQKGKLNKDYYDLLLEYR